MHQLIYRLKNEVSNLQSVNTPPEIIKIRLKEMLQWYVLDSLYNDKKYKDLIFYGGTCLRLLYDLPRMSEDLDFETPADTDISIDTIGTSIQDYFREKTQYPDTEFSTQGESIQRTTIKFPLLYDVGLSTTPGEKLHVKVEINAKPTGTYPTEMTPVSGNLFAIVIKHYDLPTLMAGKMIAALTRTYRKGASGIVTKGRDFFDLLWYMQKGIIPNENKLRDVDETYTANTVFRLLSEKIEDIPVRHLKEDLRFLFESQVFVNSWCESFHKTFAKEVTKYAA